MANIKVNIEAEVSDEVLAKLFEGFKVLGEETAKTKVEIPRVIQVEISDVQGKLTARILKEEKKE